MSDEMTKGRVIGDVSELQEGFNKRMTESKAMQRRKLLRSLPKAKLEHLAQLERPWLLDRAVLIEATLKMWDEEMAEEVLDYFRGVIK